MPTFPQMQVRSGHILLLRNSGVALGESAQHAPSFRCCLCRQSRAALLPSGDGRESGLTWASQSLSKAEKSPTEEENEARTERNGIKRCVLLVVAKYRASRF